MARSNIACECRGYYCYSLEDATPEDERDIMAFTPVDPNGAGLVEYLQRSAFPDEESGLMCTYLVRHKATEELAGYFSLKAGLVSLNEVRDGQRVEFDTIPGVELANFAVNGSFRARHEAAKGCGRVIYNELIREVIRRAAALVGVAVVYLFSLPGDKVIANYQRYGFTRLPAEDEAHLHSRLKPRYDEKCVFMYAML